MPEALWMVKHNDTGSLAGDGPGIVNPIRGLSPNIFLALSAARIEHAPQRRAQLRAQPDAECPLLGVAESDRTIARRDDKIAIDDALAVIALKDEYLRFMADDPA